MKPESRPRTGFPAQPSQLPEWQWFHIVLTAYGAWLYGDARGFRTRHHREHVEGDYKSPPPRALYADKEVRSRESLKQDPVEWSPEWRVLVGEALIARLQELGGFVLCAAMGRQHAHILAKLPRKEARDWCGLAKKHAWFAARDHGWTGKMWGKRSKQGSVKDRQHQLNVYRYILAHEDQGAWIWCWNANP